MLPDFQMIVHKFPDRPDITIVPLADVHIGSPECMEEEFIDFLGRVALTPNVYLALGGDLVDNVTRNSVGSVFTQRYRPADQKKLIAKLLEPVRDRILVAVQGNHEARSMKDADDCPLYDIMCKLDIEHLYRENIAFAKAFDIPYRTVQDWRLGNRQVPEYIKIMILRLLGLTDQIIN